LREQQEARQSAKARVKELAEEEQRVIDELKRCANPKSST
jgi:hypothetical protein